MHRSQFCEALIKRKRLKLCYKGHYRLVEVYIVGTNRDGGSVALVWQVMGGSNSDEKEGWKLLYIENVTYTKILEEKFVVIRPDYEREHPFFHHIDCRI